MKQVLLLILGIFSVGILSLHAAEGCGGNLTTVDYKICAGDLSPLTANVVVNEATPRGSIMAILNFISTILLYIIPTLAGLSGIIAGYYYIFSSGDSENTSRAKTIIKYNLISIALALGSYSIILFITTLLG